MQTKYEFAANTSEKIVYVRPMLSQDLPQDVRDHVGEAETVYSVHNENGEQLAIVADRRLAFHLARENDYSPVSVH